MAKEKKQKRRRINCQFTASRHDPVKSLRPVQDEFVCSGCSSVLRRGQVYECELCKIEIGICCKSEHEGPHADAFDVRDYLPPIACTNEGRTRCWCCDRLLCRDHCHACKSADVPVKTEAFDFKETIPLCANCRITLIPESEGEYPRPYQDEW